MRCSRLEYDPSGILPGWPLIERSACLISVQQGPHHRCSPRWEAHHPSLGWTIWLAIAVGRSSKHPT